MRTWIVLPLKERRQAKARLAPAIDADGRTRLAWHLARHTAGVLQNVSEARVVVVSRDAGFLALARWSGFAAICEVGEGHVAAASQGARWAADRGAESVLALAADLPLLAPADVRALLSRGAPDRVVLAPDRSGVGTNAVLAAPGFPFSFGAPSLDRHAALAIAAGLIPVTVRTPGLALDLDTPGDLTFLAQLRAGAPEDEKEMPSHQGRRRRRGPLHHPWAPGTMIGPNPRP